MSKVNEQNLLGLMYVSRFRKRQRIKSSQLVQ